MAPLRLAIIGGGFTGVVLAIHAIRASDRALAITVVEPDAEIGRGIAYRTFDPAHVINVPSQRMAMASDDPDGPTRWLFDQGILPDAASTDAEGHHYVARHHYGAFVQDTLRRVLAEAGDRFTLRHEVDTATGVQRDDTGWQVALESGQSLSADVVALCFGHAAPALPCPASDEVLRHPKFVANPWTDDALAAIASTDHVLVAGTGLTMADTVTSLLRRRHQGPITAVSRRGLLPRAHRLFINDLPILDGGSPPTTARGLLRLVRQSVRRYRTLGWHPAIDSIRVHLPILWQALSAREQRRVVRRLLPFWEVHRFRIAPQVDAMLTDARDRGQLVIVPAALAGLSLRDGRFAAQLRRAGDQSEERLCAALVLCTGPRKDPRRHPLVAGMVDGGLVCLDGVGMGLAVDSRSRLIDRSGRPHEGLLAFGPLTRGTFGEMTGAPDIARHVEVTARDFFNRLPLLGSG